MSKCKFDVWPGYCTILTEKECDGCKFYKTKKEFNEGLERANEILAKKGLVPVNTVDKTGKNIISVQKI